MSTDPQSRQNQRNITQKMNSRISLKSNSKDSEFMILLMLATGIKSSSCNGTNWSEKKRSKAKSSTKIDKSWPCLKNSVSFAEKNKSLKSTSPCIFTLFGLAAKSKIFKLSSFATGLVLVSLNKKHRDLKKLYKSRVFNYSLFIY